MGIVALVTDFGTRDWFVGSMKGVMLGVDPTLRIVDITHEIPAGDIAAGAFALMSSLEAFPHNTVFMAVIDPGVGSARRAVVARSGEYGFVGPDNGVLSLALGRGEDIEVRAIENKKFMRERVSSTFHGRDIFAPVAAHLARGQSLETFGPLISDYLRLPWPEPAGQGGRLRARVIYIDRFGNAVTAVQAAHLSDFLSDLNLRKGYVKCSACDSIPIGSFYQQVAAGEPLALIGSSGFMEISINNGNAAQQLNIEVGDIVEVCRG